MSKDDPNLKDIAVVEVDSPLIKDIGEENLNSLKNDGYQYVNLVYMNKREEYIDILVKKLEAQESEDNNVYSLIILFILFLLSVRERK
jgi:hypothetical protein